MTFKTSNANSPVIPANPENLEIGTNGRNIFKNRDIPEFPIHYYRQIFAKIGTPGKIALFLPFFGGQNRDSPYKIGTVGRYCINSNDNELTLGHNNVLKTIQYNTIRNDSSRGRTNGLGRVWSHKGHTLLIVRVRNSKVSHFLCSSLRLETFLNRPC